MGTNEAFMIFYNKQNIHDQRKLNHFFGKIKSRVTCSTRIKTEIVNDYENALLYYDWKISIDESLSRLNPDNLWRFYSEAPKRWFPLDNVAKIYPLTMHDKWMAMFRLSFYLKEDIIPELLQIALTTTIKRFPYFSTTIKKWFFWHYLDTIQTRFFVEEEKSYLCEPMNISTNKSKLFRVIYWENRISVEFFHILTDWLGGMEFLKSLVAEYLKLCWTNIDENDMIKDINEHVPEAELKNDYTKAVKVKKAKWFSDQKALKIDGKKWKVLPTEMIHFDLNCDDIKSLAREKWISVTTLILGFIFVATAESTKKTKWNIQIQMPVNMRRFYDSDTLANFSLFTLIKEEKKAIQDFDSLLQDIQSQIKELVTKENLNIKMCYTNRVVKNVKFIPLILKKYLIRFIFSLIWNNTISNTLSNLWNIELPKWMEDEIIKADFCLWPQTARKIACWLITCHWVTTLSITKAIVNSMFERSLIKQFEQNWIQFKIHGTNNYWK